MTRYRFVRPSDGKATAWLPLPKHGISGVQIARGRRELGKKFNLELWKTKSRIADALDAGDPT